MINELGVFGWTPMENGIIFAYSPSVLPNRRSAAYQQIPFCIGWTPSIKPPRQNRVRGCQQRGTPWGGELVSSNWF